MTPDTDLVEVVRLERLLLEPTVRAQADQVREMLHPDYTEHGKCGRAWSRDDVTPAVAADPVVPGEASDFSAVRLAEHVILLTCRILGPDGSLRSSVWVREPGLGWRVRFHQGTRTVSSA